LNGRFGSFLVFASFSSRAATIPSSLYAIEVASFSSRAARIPSSLYAIEVAASNNFSANFSKFRPRCVHANQN
jgi:hypothetical protein